MIDKYKVKQNFVQHKGDYMDTIQLNFETLEETLRSISVDILNILTSSR